MRNVTELLGITYKKLEIIVIDNASEISAASVLSDFSDQIKIIRCDKNIGVSARNIGIKQAKGDIVVTLDDDVFGFNDKCIGRLNDSFSLNESLSGINFRIVDDVTEEQVNWIHHRKREDYSQRVFDTYEISEGAVAFRKDILLKTDLYPEYYFISHEGPDLALQIFKKGGSLQYDPNVQVRHAHSPIARTNWRRYYYDPRNQIWLACRHYPLFMATRKLFIGLISMFFYSLRDGYLKYYLKGIFHAIVNVERSLRERQPLNGLALEKYISLESYNAGLFYMIKKRVFSKNVKI